MLEYIVGYGIIAVIFAIWYAVIPKESPLRVLFFSLSLLTMVIMVYTLYHAEEVTYISQKYDATNTLVETVKRTVTIPTGVKDVTATFLEAELIVLGLVLSLTIIMFLYKVFSDVIKDLKRYESLGG